MKYLWLVAIFTTKVFAQYSYIAPARLLGDGGTEIRGEGRLWNSAQRLDQNGESVPYAVGEGFSYMEGIVNASYGATKELQLGMRATFRQNQALIEEPANSGRIETLTASGIQSIGADFKYMLEPVGNLYYAFEGFYYHNTFSNKEKIAGDNISNFLLSDDGGSFGVGGIVSYIHPNQNFFSLNLGYRRPGKELSPEIYWKAEGALAWNHFALIAGIEGVNSLDQDPYKTDPDNRPVFNTGGSSLYASLNRQFMAPYVGANIAFSKNWRVESRFYSFIAQRSYDSGTMFTLALVKRVETDTRAKIEGSFKEYDLEASVAKVSPKKQFVILNKGLSQNVQMGQRFDLYYFDYVGGNVLLARGVIIQVNSDQSVLQLTTRFSNKHEIKEGTLARGLAK
jgi:hypothetical protein